MPWHASAADHLASALRSAGCHIDPLRFDEHAAFLSCRLGKLFCPAPRGHLRYAHDCTGAPACPASGGVRCRCRDDHGRACCGTANLGDPEHAPQHGRALCIVGAATLQALLPLMWASLRHLFTSKLISVLQAFCRVWYVRWVVSHVAQQQMGVPVHAAVLWL